MKTLNDLKIDAITQEQKEPVVRIDEIKQEAIKVMKDALKKRKNMFKVFIEFHNIKLEDLK